MSNDSDSDSEPEINDYTQMLYYQNSIGAFTRKFIQNNRDTLRWLMDVRIYVAKHHAHGVPERMLYDKILNSISPRQQLLYNQWFTEQVQLAEPDDPYIADVEALKEWVKYQYKPPKSVEFMYDALRSVKHRPEEDPLMVYNKWLVMVQTISLCIDILNEDDDDEQLPTVQPFTDRMKFESLNRIFVIENNAFAHGTRGRVNDATKKYIVKAPAPRTLEQYITRINELHDHLQPAILSKAAWNKYTTYVPDDIQSILFGHSSKHKPVNPKQTPLEQKQQRGTDQLIIFTSRGNNTVISQRGGQNGRGRGNRHPFDRYGGRGGRGGRGRGGHRGGYNNQRGGYPGRGGRGGYRGGRGGSRGGRGGNRGRGNKRYRDASFGDNTDNKRAKYDITCHRCGKRGHFKAECTSTRHRNGTYLTSQPQSRQQQQPPHGHNKKGNCYRCGRTGHFRKDCTALTNVAGKPIYDALSIGLAAKQKESDTTNKNDAHTNRPRPFGQWNNF